MSAWHFASGGAMPADECVAMPQHSERQSGLLFARGPSCFVFSANVLLK